MRRLVPVLGLLGTTLLAACGGGASTSNRSTSASVRQALTASPEMLELEPLSVRQDLFRATARASVMESAGLTAGPVLFFPMVQNGGLHAAPGFEGRLDLFQSPDAGEAVTLSLAPGQDGWPEVRRDSLQGLSEREAAELIARNLSTYWNLKDHATLRVERAVGAPYAVAYADGVLRVNPSFLYMAAAYGMSPATP